MELRIGQGIDIHPFEQGRPCVLGGVEIPHHEGLKGDLKKLFDSVEVGAAIEVK